MVVVGRVADDGGDVMKGWRSQWKNCQSEAWND